MTVTVDDNKEKLKKMHKEDSKLVKGRFMCHEPKGGQVSFSYRKYKQDPTQFYTFRDGEDYEIPKGVAKHINNCSWDVHTHLLDAKGEPYQTTGKKERRFTFQATEFV